MYPNPEPQLGQAISGFLVYYEFRGTASSPLFRADPGGPLNGEVVSGSTYPSFGDLNGDGANDLVAGSDQNHLFYYKNEGTASLPVYSYGPSIFSAKFMDSLASYRHMSPTFADLDGDGDLDMWIGSESGTLGPFENFGP